MNDAPFFAMSEYDSRSKCDAFECQRRGFARKVIVRDDRESTEKVKLERARSAPWGHNLYEYYAQISYYSIHD